MIHTMSHIMKGTLGNKYYSCIYMYRINIIYIYIYIYRFCSGSLAGVTAQTFVYPLEVAKTRLNLCKPGFYNGPVDCLKKVIATEGPLAVYAGLIPSLVGIVPYAGIELSANSIIKENISSYLESRGQEAGVAVLLFSGMTSSTLAMFLTYPLNLIRTKVQANGLLPKEKRYTGVSHIVKSIYQKDGWKGFYRGIIPNLLKVIPSTGISYTSYQYFNDVLKKFRR